MPAQSLLILGACLDEVLAVVEQQLQLQGGLVEVGARQRLGALPQRRSGDGQGIDRVGLAAGALTLAGGAHQLRGDSHHALSRCDQEALEGAGDVAAVLQRPDPLLIEAPPPVEELAEARLPGRRGQLAGELTGSRKDRAAGVGSFVGVRSDHDHLACPFDWLSPVGADR